MAVQTGCFSLRSSNQLLLPHQDCEVCRSTFRFSVRYHRLQRRYTYCRCAIGYMATKHSRAIDAVNLWLIVAQHSDVQDLLPHARPSRSYRCTARCFAQLSLHYHATAATFNPWMHLASGVYTCSIKQLVQRVYWLESRESPVLASAHLQMSLPGKAVYKWLNRSSRMRQERDFNSAVGSAHVLEPFYSADRITPGAPS